MPEAPPSSLMLLSARLFPHSVCSFLSVIIFPEAPPASLRGSTVPTGGSLGTVWNHLEPAGTTWNCLEPSGTTWNCLEPVGTSLNWLKPAGISCVWHGVDSRCVFLSSPFGACCLNWLSFRFLAVSCLRHFLTERKWVRLSISAPDS